MRDGPAVGTFGTWRKAFRDRTGGELCAQGHRAEAHLSEVCVSFSCSTSAPLEAERQQNMGGWDPILTLLSLDKLQMLRVHEQMPFCTYPMGL